MTERDANAADLALRIERQRGDEMAALADALRKALETVQPWGKHFSDPGIQWVHGQLTREQMSKIEAALALAPSAALEDRDREAREQLAKWLEERRAKHDDSAYTLSRDGHFRFAQNERERGEECDEIAAAIRRGEGQA